MGIRERKERDKRQMQDMILKEAMKLFLEEGFEKVSVRHIAEKIEYSPATIYLYFKDKDEILFRLHEEGFIKLYKIQEELLTIKNPFERLKKHGEVYVDFALKNPEYYNLMFLMEGPMQKVHTEWGCGHKSFEMLMNNIQECMDQGYVKKSDVHAASIAIWSFVHGLVSLIIRKRLMMIPKEHLDSIILGALHFQMENFKK